MVPNEHDDHLIRDYVPETQDGMLRYTKDKFVTGRRKYETGLKQKWGYTWLNYPLS